MVSLLCLLLLSGKELKVNDIQRSQTNNKLWAPLFMLLFRSFSARFVFMLAEKEKEKKRQFFV